MDSEVDCAPPTVFDADLSSTLRKLLNDVSLSSVIVTIKNEEMKMLCDPIPSTGLLSYNVHLLRLVLRRYDTKAAYIVMRLPNGSLCALIYIAENADPRDSMKYLLGHYNLYDSLKPHEFFTMRVNNISEIQAKAFEALSKETNLDDLMTESERLQKEISEMEPAPQMLTLPGILIPLSEGARDVMMKYAVGLVDTATFMIEKDKITVDRVLEEQIGGLAALKDILPGTCYRYVIAHYRPADSDANKNIMAYMCPSSSDLKERMLYASAKAGFISSANNCGIKFHLKKEAGSCDELISLVRDAFSDSLEIKC